MNSRHNGYSNCQPAENSLNQTPDHLMIAIMYIMYAGQTSGAKYTK